MTRAQVGATLWEDQGAMPRPSGGLSGAIAALGGVLHGAPHLAPLKSMATQTCDSVLFNRWEWDAVH